MKVLILGCGAQGSVIATHLAKSPHVNELRLADVSIRKAKSLANRLQSDKVTAYKVNANNLKRLLKVAKKVDVVVNAASYSWSIIENSMEAALTSGAHYVDLAGIEQVRFNNKWEDAGLTAIIGMGEDPGITNLLAAKAADEMDAVDEIRMRDWGSVNSKEMVSSWSPAAAWADFAEEPIIYDHGVFKRVPPFSGEEVYKFPPPIGPQTVTWHAHEEVVSLPQYIKGVKYVDFKLGIPDLTVVRYIINLGLLSDRYVSVKGRRISPRTVFTSLLPRTLSMDEVEEKIAEGSLTDEQECITVEVKGEKEGQKTEYAAYVLMSLQEANTIMPGATALSYLVGTPAAVAIEMLLKGEIKTKGVVAPEGLNRKERNALLTGITEKGIKIRDKTRTLYSFRVQSLEDILAESR
ncbi:MAG: saccharopine dehydrogenase C-terminal domain-containing protein [Candidatus Bathyarchaeota archaeon]|nr:saccharopine dehydrogenase C-terminal domain-containing protein [Candidatus Bathyarchaeota archaeon]